MKLLDFYKAILATANILPDSQDRFNVVYGTDSKPFLVDKQQLALPTPDRMRNPDNTLVLFNPLQEDLLLMSESPVMARFRLALNIRMNHAVSTLLTSLMQLAASPGDQAKLTPDHLEVLTALKDVTKDTFEKWAKLIERMPPGDKEKCFVRFYVKPRAKLGDQSFQKAAIITFPFYESFDEASNEVYGVKFNKKEGKAIRSLLELVFPGLEKQHQFSRGSNHLSVPTLDAVLKGIVSVAQGINYFAEIFKDVLEDIVDAQLEAKWSAFMADYSIFDAELRLIPMQRGNGATTEAAAPAATSLSKAPVTRPAGFGQTSFGNRNQAPAAPTGNSLSDLLQRANLNQRQSGFQSQQPQTPWNNEPRQYSGAEAARNGMAWGGNRRI